MNENRTTMEIQDEETPYIKREIDGCIYTVLIHFRLDSRETARDKVKRLLVKDALAGNFPETH